MTTKTVVLGDKAVQVMAEDAAEVERFKSEALKQLSDAESKLKSTIEAKDSELGELKAKLADAEKELADAKSIDVDALVAARSELVAQVKAFDASIEVAGKSDIELKRAVVSARYGDELASGASDVEIAAMFKVAAKDAKTNPVASIIKAGIKTNDAAQACSDAFKKSVDGLIVMLQLEKTVK